MLIIHLFSHKSEFLLSSFEVGVGKKIWKYCEIQIPDGSRLITAELNSEYGFGNWISYHARAERRSRYLTCLPAINVLIEDKVLPAEHGVLCYDLYSLLTNDIFISWLPISLVSQAKLQLCYKTLSPTISLSP